MRKTVGATILILMLSVALLAGCSKVTQENYNKLEVGMTYEQVTELLGKPDTCNSTMNANRCTWGDENRYIKIVFVGGKILMFSSSGL